MHAFRIILPALAVCCLSAQTAQPTLGQEPDARQILQKAIDAAGGEQALAVFKTPTIWTERGTNFDGEAGTPYVARYVSKWPDQYRQELEGLYALTASGEEAWITTAAGAVALEGPALKEFQTQVRVAWAERLFPLLDEKQYTLSSAGPIAVGGKPAVGIVAKHTDGRDITLYFDRESHRLVKIETQYVAEPGGKPQKLEAYYSEHKPFGGPVVPTAFEMFLGGRLVARGQSAEVKTDATLDPKLFQMPADTQKAKTGVGPE